MTAKEDKGTAKGAQVSRLGRAVQRALAKRPIKVRMRSKNQITVPAGVAEELHVAEGDEVEFALNDRGEVVVRGYTSVPTDQAWFFTPEWLEGEREASEQIAAGQTDVYEDVDALFAGLAEDDEDDEGEGR